jgi:hypothetical protein
MFRLKLDIIKNKLHKYMETMPRTCCSKDAIVPSYYVQVVKVTQSRYIPGVAQRVPGS